MVEESAQLTDTGAVPAERGLFIYTLGKAVSLYLLYAVLVTALNVYAPPLPPFAWAIIGVCSTIAYLLVLVYVMRLLAQPTLSVRQELSGCLLSCVLFIALNPLTWEAVQMLRQGMTLGTVFAELSTPSRNPITDILVPFFLLLSGAFLGRMMARLIRERAIILPVGLIAGLVDFWGVYWGPVSIMSASAPVAVSRFGSAATMAATVPKVALESLSGPLAVLAHITPPDSIGLGDFVFLTFFLACALRLNFSVKCTMWGLFAGLFLASIIMGLNGQTVFGHDVNIDYLPGLVFIAGGVLLANLRAWQLTRREWAMTGVLVLLLAGLITCSAVRDRQNRAQDEPETFTITALSNSALVEQTFARLRKDHPKDTVLPQEAEFIFKVEPTGVRLRGWEAAAISFLPSDPLHSCKRYDLTGSLEKSDNACTVKALCTTYAVPDQKTAPKMQRWIQHLPSVPSSLLALLDQTPAYSKSAAAQGSTAFIVQLSPTTGKLFTDKGKLLTRVDAKGNRSRGLPAS
jgi:hypothetical protein